MMLIAALLAPSPFIIRGSNTGAAWKLFSRLALAALLAALAAPLLHLLSSLQGTAGNAVQPQYLPGVIVTPFGAWFAVLVQFLGTVIGAFSARYLYGEPGQARYITALATVLAAVHVLLLANHWLVLILAWAMVGEALQRLLGFYPERPFALLAAHKKRIADRLADGMLLAAAALAWYDVGSGSFDALWRHLEGGNASVPLQLAAAGLVLAVILRTALLPVHGWLMQVMEAPTPVSALLHAGVINLGGFVLIRFAPLLDAAPAARWILAGAGLLTALLAGLAMLTRISIKVRLAWSTCAQMGFMVLECGLGLYTLAALHLIGHSLYKAHAFLASSSVVQQTRRDRMRGASGVSAGSAVAAPFVAAAIITPLLMLANLPWWWSGVLAFAWAPLLWLPGTQPRGEAAWQALAGVAMVAGLSLLMACAHKLPLGLHDAPRDGAGLVALLGMGVMYLSVVALRLHPQGMEAWRRWSYAGFHVDETYTRLALRLWPGRWMPAASVIARALDSASPATSSSR